MLVPGQAIVQVFNLSSFYVHVYNIIMAHEFEVDEACNFFFNSKFSSKHKRNVGIDFIITLDVFIYILL